MATAKVNPEMKLYHITRRVNAELIDKYGFSTRMRHAEGGEAAFFAERLLNLLQENDTDLDDALDKLEEEMWHESGEISHESSVREVFNQILEKARPGGLPSHIGSAFFWPTSSQARFRRSRIEGGGRKYATIEVDATKIPCRCYAADIGKTDELFNKIDDNLERAEACTGFYTWPYTGEESEEVEEFCDTLEELSETYYREMNPVTGEERGGEVLCECDIPPEAITKIDRG